MAWTNDQIGNNALVGNIVPLNDLGVDEAFLKSTYEAAPVNGMIWNGEIWGLPETEEGITLVYNKALGTNRTSDRSAGLPQGLLAGQDFC
ncbi:hypothetical protein [Candidatus Amarolinea dominans]|uniref:hypothetical protein n=1 Tax=Candidatus Amarolinea dominans TaxID=3140696 RepID=UPI0031CCBF06